MGSENPMPISVELVSREEASRKRANEPETSSALGISFREYSGVLAGFRVSSHLDFFSLVFLSFCSGPMAMTIQGHWVPVDQSSAENSRVAVTQEGSPLGWHWGDEAARLPRINCRLVCVLSTSSFSWGLFFFGFSGTWTRRLSHSLILFCRHLAVGPMNWGGDDAERHSWASAATGTDAGFRKLLGFQVRHALEFALVNVVMRHVCFLCRALRKM